jgi:hypothetical protein
MFIDELYETAIHEAGHVVAARLAGVRATAEVFRIEDRAENDREFGGRCNLPNEGKRIPNYVFAAGDAAEFIHKGETDRTLLGISGSGSYSHFRIGSAQHVESAVQRGR